MYQDISTYIVYGLFKIIYEKRIEAGNPVILLSVFTCLYLCMVTLHIITV